MVLLDRTCSVCYHPVTGKTLYLVLSGVQFVQVCGVKLSVISEFVTVQTSDVRYIAVQVNLFGVA
jgi:hypothetical protein